MYPIQIICESLEMSRSSYYYKPVSRGEQELKEALRTIAEEFVTYGNRRLTAALRREGWSVGRDRVRRLMKELGIQVGCRKSMIKTTDSLGRGAGVTNLVQGLEIVRPDQVWVSDITYIHLIEEVVYLAILMDVFTRIIRGWQLSRSLDQHLTLRALEKALSGGHFPEIHHSDQGSQYFAGAYQERLAQVGTKVSFSDPGKPTQNAYAERVIRTIKEEEVYLNEYRNFQEAYEQIGRFIDEVYARKRIHSALGYLTPQEFEEHWYQMQKEVDLSTKNGDFCVQI